jgi:hypothetical protein
LAGDCAAKGEVLVDQDLLAVATDKAEHERDEAYRDADAAVRKFYGGKSEPPIDRIVAERNYHLLAKALRDADSPSDAFAASVMQLKSALVLDEAKRVFDEYEAWIAEEFPDSVDEETFKKLVEDAKKKSLNDLLTSYGFATIHRALGSLAAHSG